MVGFWEAVALWFAWNVVAPLLAFLIILALWAAAALWAGRHKGEGK